MMRKHLWTVLTFLLLAITACSGTSYAGAGEVVLTPTPNPEPTTSAIEAPSLPGNLDTFTIIEDDLEYVISQILPRDVIRPIYYPAFTSAEDSNYDPNELVMGVEINGDARAYPVGLLRRREMVNDIIGNTPVLVTW